MNNFTFGFKYRCFPECGTVRVGLGRYKRLLRRLEATLRVKLIDNEQ